MPDPAPALLVLAAAVVAMGAMYLVHLRTANAGYVDAAWAALLALAALYHGTTGEGAAVPRIATAVLGALWGFRLALHLLNRVLHEPEDGRYRALRARWAGTPHRWLGFFLLQALAVALFALPFQVAASNPTGGVTPWIVLGIAIWLVAIAGEAIADRQLAAHRADPANAGRTCRSGLWRWSRHPNYFFEWLHWFAYAAFAVGADAAWIALAAPALMGAMLAWGSGIPFTEQQALRTRGDDYRRYQRETSAFFPWFPSQAGADPT